MMGFCRECRHHNVNGLVAHGWGICSKMSTAWDEVIPPTLLAYADHNGDDGAMANVVSAPTFGCVMFEEDREFQAVGSKDVGTIEQLFGEGDPLLS